MAKTWPPQFSPLSMRNSATSMPFFASTLPWMSAERRSETLRTTVFCSRPSASRKKQGYSSRQLKSAGLMPAESTRLPGRRERANPRSAALASLIDAPPSRARSSLVMMFTPTPPGRIRALISRFSSSRSGPSAIRATWKSCFSGEASSSSER